MDLKIILIALLLLISQINIAKKEEELDIIK